MVDSTGSARLVLRPLVVVEGLHDLQKVKAAVDADVWVLGGDRISHRTVAELRRAEATRGVIVLTDPDGPGEHIRRRLDALVPGCMHAYVTKAEALSGGHVGVEHASVAAVQRALSQVRTHGFAVAPEGRNEPEYTLADLVAVGLTAHGEAAKRRRQVGELLGLGYGNAKAFVHKLNALHVPRAEWERACRIALGKGEERLGKP
ncbi:MAG: DUF4093 domain-containing protein [Alicyclobacillaceae bacterium]|nr:DUF4093 domain-containing protein [Alicyclobacillaceae bacterium]